MFHISWGHKSTLNACRWFHCIFYWHVTLPNKQTLHNLFHIIIWIISHNAYLYVTLTISLCYKMSNRWSYTHMYTKQKVYGVYEYLMKYSSLWYIFISATRQIFASVWRKTVFSLKFAIFQLLLYAHQKLQTMASVFYAILISDTFIQLR